MRPGSAQQPLSVQRPLSAQSIQGSTRQRLQQPNTRRVYVLENGSGSTESEPANISTNRTNSTEVWALSSPGSKPIVEDTSDKSMTGNKQQDMAGQPLKHLVFKKINRNVIEVAIRCIFLRVGEIDTLREQYYAEILLEASWEEASFKGLQKRSFDPAVHWTPKLELMNGIGELQDDITYTIRYDKQNNATVTEHHKLKGTLWERMELQYFPVDVQDLSISLTTSLINTEMIFVKNLRRPSGVNRQVFTDEQEWYLFEHVDIEVTDQINEYLDNGNNHSVVICSCHAARKYGYFIWNAYFLIFLITSASFATFPIPLENIQGRVQIACTLLLTSITFRWLCNKSLPTISYLTAVDVYAIGSIFSLCLLNIYHGVIGYVNFYIATNSAATTTSSTTTTTTTTSSSSTTTTTTATTSTSGVSSIVIIDRWALVVYTILFFAYQIGTFLWMYLVPAKKRRIMFKRDNENSVHIATGYTSSQPTFMDVLQGRKKPVHAANNISVITNIDL